jgi:hypothetical protein
VHTPVPTLFYKKENKQKKKVSSSQISPNKPSVTKKAYNIRTHKVLVALGK